MVASVHVPPRPGSRQNSIEPSLSTHINVLVVLFRLFRLLRLLLLVSLPHLAVQLVAGIHLRAVVLADDQGAASAYEAGCPARHARAAGAAAVLLADAGAAHHAASVVDGSEAGAGGLALLLRLVGGAVRDDAAAATGAGGDAGGQLGAGGGGGGLDLLVRHGLGDHVLEELEVVLVGDRGGEVLVLDVAARLAL